MNDNYLDIANNLEPSVKMQLDKIRRYLLVGKASVMVGCGFSLNAESDGTGRMKQWNDLNVDLYRSLYGKEPSEADLFGMNPIRLAAQVESSHGVHELDEIIYNALPDKCVFPGPLHKKLMKLHWHDVFTTNYDTLLERSCSESGSAYTVVTNKETLLYSTSPRIIKLHGSFPDIRPFIMSEESFRTYPTKYPEFVNTVRQALIENLFCLIGFSGNDPNFLSWLGWIRDVMGDQMINAILVDFKKTGIHTSEKKLFANRKIDILNLGEIKGLDNYTSALDFFLTYIGKPEPIAPWKYPQVYKSKSIIANKDIDYNSLVQDLTDARLTYPGWVIMPESITKDCGIHHFPFIESMYKEMPEDLKLKYLFELNWALDKCLYPKMSKWYVSALEDVKKRYPTLSSDDKVLANQLIISLFAMYRDAHLLDEFLAVKEYVEQNLITSLTHQQLSVYYYELCLWSLSVLDYKEVYSFLLKWHLQENDFLGALWQSSVYAEIGDKERATDILVSYYSRLTTRRLQDTSSQFLESCFDLYSYVLPRRIHRRLVDIDFVNNSKIEIEIRKRYFVEESLKERPLRSTTHGFNLGQVRTSSHMYQGGYVHDYLYASRYLRLTQLHGTLSCVGNGSELDEYRKMLQIISKYSFYNAISMAIRTGDSETIRQVSNREILSRVSKSDIQIIFTDIFETFKDVYKVGNSNQKTICFNSLLTLLQHLCTKGDDSLVNDLFGLIMNNVSESRINRNDLLKTVYDNASTSQLADMFIKVMETPISRDKNMNDILWPQVNSKVKISKLMIQNATKFLTNKELKPHSYARVLALLDNGKKDSNYRQLTKHLINWRKKEKHDINAFFSYRVVPATDEADRDLEKHWIGETVSEFIRRDYDFQSSSSTLFDFSRFLDNTLPGITYMTKEQVESIVKKILETMDQNKNMFNDEDNDEIIGGMNFFFNHFYQCINRIFERIDISMLSDDLRSKLSSFFKDLCLENRPFLRLLCIISPAEEMIGLFKMAIMKMFDNKHSIRFDALRTIYWILYKNYISQSSEEVSECTNKVKYYLEYSQNKSMGEHLGFLSSMCSEKILQDDILIQFDDALEAIYDNIKQYRMPFNYTLDIAYQACLLTGLLSRNKSLKQRMKSLKKWKSYSEDPEQFRDIRNGFINGIKGKIE